MPEEPNVVVIMADQLKATASHLYGNDWFETPHLEALADRGVRFDHAYTPHPLCVPARVSMWTGQYPHTHGARRNETLMPGDANHAFDRFADAGYHCGLIGKNHCFESAADLATFDTWCPISHRGLPEDDEPRGMEWFRPRESIESAHEARQDMPRQSRHFGYAVTDHPLADYSSGLIAGQTERFFEQHGDDPFALWVSFPDPHEPYEAPREYVEQVPKDEIVLPPWSEDEFDDSAAEPNRLLYRMLGMEDDDPEDVRGVLQCYYAMVRFLDDMVGRITTALEENGLREDTIVVFCADHGDFAGEHRMTCKGGAFYDCLTRVPLIVSWPETLPSGVTEESMVNLVDVVPTLYELLGWDVPRAMDGTPLPTVTDAEPRDAAFSEYGCGGPPFCESDLEDLESPYGRDTLIESLRWREAEGRRKMVRTQDWKYVHDPDRRQHELYDLEADPWELDNVVDDPGNDDVVARLRRRLLDWSIRTEDGTPVPLPGEEP
jgi:arylsulfatase A-like enzyme